MTYLKTTPTRRRPWVALIVIASAWIAIAMALGCAPNADSGGTDPDADPRGMYDLEAINDLAIPSKAYHGPYFDPATTRFYNQQIVMVNRGSINLLNNGNWAITMDLTINRDGVVSTKAYYADGTYEIIGDELRLTTRSGLTGNATGTFGDGTLRLTLDLMGAKTTRQYDFGR
jgi:hypothetical protein